MGDVRREHHLREFAIWKMTELVCLKENIVPERRERDLIGPNNAVHNVHHYF